MKRTAFLLAIVFLVFPFSVTFADDNRIELSTSDALEAFCGIWFTDVGAREDRFVYNKDGTYYFYYPKLTSPSFSGKFKLEEAWKDSEGNVWLIFWYSFRGGMRALTKISNDGTARESVRRYAGNELPKTIDLNDPKYARFTRERIK